MARGAAAKKPARSGMTAKEKKAARSAEALAAVDTDKPLFDQDEDKEVASQVKKRRRGRTIEEQVQKSLRGNFPGFRAGQATLLVNKDGKTLTQVLTEDRTKVELKDPSAHHRQALL